MFGLHKLLQHYDYPLVCTVFCPISILCPKNHHNLYLFIYYVAEAVKRRCVYCAFLHIYINIILSTPEKIKIFQSKITYIFN